MEKWRTISRMSLMLVRPFHIVHQWALIFMALSVKGILGKVSPLDLFTVWIIVFLVMPLLFSINDLLHLEEDKKMKRERLFTVLDIPKRQLTIILTSLILLLILLAGLRNILTLGFLILLMIFATAYGYYKHKKRTILTYSFRTLSGFALYLVISSYFGLTVFDILLAIFVGLTDLQVHIIGDVRDILKDKVADVRTLPVIYGIRATNLIVLVLQFISTSFLLILSNITADTVINSKNLLSSVFVGIPRLAIIWVVSFYLVAWVVYLFLLQREKVPYQWLHACFHGAKVMTFVSIGISISGSTWVIVFFFIIWILSYTTYLWADNRL